MRPVRNLAAVPYILILLWTGCPARPGAPAAPSVEPAVYPAAAFVVMSDLHVYDTILGTSGPAFCEYLATDRKLLVESAELAAEAVLRIIAEQPDFVVVAGDLTKDGEGLSHDRVTACLQPLREQGIPVFVVPGNHDINNPEAARYDEEGSHPLPSISAPDFARRYADFGYAAAFERDTASLSYAAEPVAGLWLIGLDANRYRENRPGRLHIVAGRLRAPTMAWLAQILQRAARAGMPVIVFMHHGVLEHFDGQARQFPEYLVANRRELVSLLERHRVPVVFTGHFHAQDITVRRGSGAIYDIQTGSLVSYPVSYRRIEIGDNQNMLILTRRIDALPSRPSGFAGYARQYTRQGLIEAGERQFKRYRVPPASRRTLAPLVADLILGHYAGDEAGQTLPIDRPRIGCLAGLMIGYRFDILEGLNRDLEPPDNDLLINLATGDWLLPR